MLTFRCFPSWPLALLGLLFVLPMVQPSSADEGETAKVSPLRALLDEAVTWDKLATQAEPSTIAEPRIALRWANNSRGSETGLTVLYIARGVPLAVCCIYPWETDLIHEFDSTSRLPLESRRHDVLSWQPETGGAAFQPVPQSDRPADTRPARLRQLKQLASRFESTMLGWKGDSSDREQLRLLPQPLFRYEPAEGQPIEDGAVFAFVQGTDPESLLLLEAIRLDGDLRWEYSFIRRTSGQLEGRCDGAVVWHVDRFPTESDPTSPHCSLRTLLPADVSPLGAATPSR